MFQKRLKTAETLPYASRKSCVRRARRHSQVGIIVHKDKPFICTFSVFRFPRRSFQSCGEFHVTDWEMDVAELNGSSHSDKLNDGDDHMKEKDDNIAHARMVSAEFCISPPTGAVRCKTHHHDVCAHWSRVNASWASRLFGSARRRMW